MIDWFVQTLRSYPEIAIFLSLALGYYFGSFTYKGLGLGAVTATLIAAVIIGQLDITITGPLKPTFFLMFLFAIGYGVGPQFVRGIAKDGVPQALFAAVVCVFCLAAPVIAAKIAGYDIGSAAGLYAGSQTISASMGLATDAINRLGLPPEETKKLLDAMPVAYAVTYIFGTVGSALVLALLGPALLGIDLEAACKRYEEKHGGKKGAGGPGTAWHQFELRAFRVAAGGQAVGKTVPEAEALLPEQRVFVQRIRRGGKIIDATADTVIQAGDVVAVAGRREVLVNLIGAAAEEVDDRELLAVPIEGVDVYVTSKEADGKTLAELAKSPRRARRVPAQDHSRSDRDRYPDPAEHGGAAGRYPYARRTYPGHRGRDQDAGCRRSRDRRGRRGVHRCGDHDRRAGRRDRLQGRHRAAHAVHLRRRVDCRPLLRLAALRAADVRTDSVVHRLVHEFGRPERIHRRRRHLVRSGVRRRAATARLRPVPLGRLRDDRAAHPGDVRREIPVPLRRRHCAGMLAPVRARRPPRSA